MTRVLEVDRAAKRFGATQALRGVSVTLDASERLALLGPNGAGKTTLLRAISGLVRLDSGEIRLFGQPVSPATRAASDVHLGVVPQELALYPMLTASENLLAFGGLLGLSGPVLRERVAWALHWARLEDRADHRVKTFSGGMKRRLNIACSVLHRPPVLLLDEPTVGVDPQSRQRIWEMLDELRASGTALLLTTHQMDEAQTVCERIVIIDHGQVIAAGTLEELIQQTIGPRRQVVLQLDAPLPAGLGADCVVDGRCVRAAVADVAQELPALLARVKAGGRRVEDIHVEQPSLHAVFIHLTGKELRE